MNCRECIDFLIDYFAGDLPPCERALFQAHLGKCPECVAYLHNYEQTVRLCRGSFADHLPPPGEVPEELIRAILASRPAPNDSPRA